MTTSTLTVTVKGQVILHRRVLDHLGVAPGDQLEVVLLPGGRAVVVANRPAAEAGLAFLKAGGDFADGVIAHEGRLPGGEIFTSFDRLALVLARKVGVEAQAPREG